MSELVYDTTTYHRLRLGYNLQFFAKEGPGGEKTEEPTSKKLEDSRKEGQVAKSQELGNAAMLIGIFVSLKFICSFLGQRFIENFNIVYNRIPDLVKMHGDRISSYEISNFIGEMMLRILVMLSPFFLVSVIIGFVVNLVQVKWKPTTKPLQPKFDKLNPLKGVKRLFSPSKLMDLFKSVAKIIIITAVAYNMLKNQLDLLFLLYDIPLTQSIVTVGEIIINVGLRISIVYLILGFVDFGYQKWKFHEDMKMTKQEVKDEMKNSEGDPQVKSQQRRRMQESSRRRMMSSVPQADVVITNPTHFAVCLKYDNMIADAPIVTAKGCDHLAQRIKEVAKENGVEIVENKPLARMLYHNVQLGDMVPPELYQAVAEILAFVYNLKKNRAS